MKYISMISFPSPTAAEKALRTLAAAGFPVKRIRLPQQLGEEGCVTGVVFPCRDAEEPRLLLDRLRIPYRRIYLERAGDET